MVLLSGACICLSAAVAAIAPARSRTPQEVNVATDCMPGIALAALASNLTGRQAVGRVSPDRLSPAFFSGIVIGVHSPQVAQDGGQAGGRV